MRNCVSVHTRPFVAANYHCNKRIWLVAWLYTQSDLLQQSVAAICVSCVPALTWSIIFFIRFDAILLVCFLENVLYSSVCTEDKGKLAHLPLNIRYTPELQNEPHQAISSFVPSHFFNLQCCTPWWEIDPGKITVVTRKVNLLCSRQPGLMLQIIYSSEYTQGITLFIPRRWKYSCQRYLPQEHLHKLTNLKTILAQLERAS